MAHPVHYDWLLQKVHDAVVPFSFGFELEKERFLKYLKNSTKIVFGLYKDSVFEIIEKERKKSEPKTCLIKIDLGNFHHATGGIVTTHMTFGLEFSPF